MDTMAAASAAEVYDRAVEVEDAVGGEAGAFEEVIHVLGHDDSVGVPEGVLGDPAVRRVGLAAGEVVAAGVVPGVDLGAGGLAAVVLAGEPLFDRAGLVGPAGPSESRDAAVGGEACAGEEDRFHGAPVKRIVFKVLRIAGGVPGAQPSACVSACVSAG
jgi:hypothetical protein